MGNTVTFKVFVRIGALGNINPLAVIQQDERYEDVTYEREWFINPDGALMYITDDIDEPLKEAESCYFYTVEVI